MLSLQANNCQFDTCAVIAVVEEVLTYSCKTTLAHIVPCKSPAFKFLLNYRQKKAEKTLKCSI